MHRSTCSRSHRGRRARSRSARRSPRSWPLKDRPAALNPSRCTSRSRIDRSWPSLWHHYAPRRRFCNRSRNRRCNRLRRSSLRCRFNRRSCYGRCRALLRYNCRNHRRGCHRCRRRSGNHGCCSHRRRCRPNNFHCGSRWLHSHRRTLHGYRCLALGRGGRSGRRSLCRCRRGGGWRSNHNRRARNHWPHRRLARNRRWWSSHRHYRRGLPRLRHNPPRRWRCYNGRTRWRRSLYLRRRLGHHRRSRRRPRCCPPRWRAACLLCTHLCGKDNRRRIARLRYVR